jgi:hypothetical protein
MGKEEIEDKTVKDFIQKLKKRFKIERIILFGSRARGDALKDSDYDFIIVSKDFEGIFFTERTSLLYDLWNSEFSLEALCYTPEEFNKKAREISIVKEALSHGIHIS